MLNFFTNSSPLIQALIAGLFTWLITLLGASLVFFFKKVNENILNLTLGFSAGIMIAASIFSLIEPAIEMCNNMHKSSYIIISLGIILGVAFLIICTKLCEKFIKNNINNKKRSLLLVSAITIHNIPEGLIVGVSFGSLAYHITGSSLIGAITLTIGIAIQNFPEGCAISLPLRREGLSTKKAFFYGQLSAIVEPISAVIGAILVIKVKMLLPYLLSIASGAMLYVVIEELIPESQKNSNKTLMTIITILGFIIMMSLDIALG